MKGALQARTWSFLVILVSVTLVVLAQISSGIVLSQSTKLKNTCDKQDVPGKMPRITFVPEEIDGAYSEKWRKIITFWVAQGGGLWTKSGEPISPKSSQKFSEPVKAIAFIVDEKTTYVDILRAARIFDRGLPDDGKLTIYLVVPKKPNRK